MLHTHVRHLGAILLIALLLASAVRADFDPNVDPSKFIQLPDLSPNGLDVNATWKGPPPQGLPNYPFRKILADDFWCVTTEPITDVHIWGSWLNDLVAPDVYFKLSIHADIPADPANGIPYSRPGPELWAGEFQKAPTAAPLYFTERLYAENVQERFYDPNNHEFIGQDTKVWQYNFYIPPALAFVQQGNPNAPVIYWLDVQAIIPPIIDPGTGEASIAPEVFGWKTSFQHWNDDAVYGDTSGPGLSGVLSEQGWRELRYPGEELPNNPLPVELWGKSIDLAFVITPEPGTALLLTVGALALLRRGRR